MRIPRKNAERRDLQIVDWESLAPFGWYVTYWFNQPKLEARLIEMASLSAARFIGSKLNRMKHGSKTAA